MELKLGIVDDYFSHVGVMAFKLDGELKVGDTIHIKGHTTEIVQTVESIEIEHKKLDLAKKGDNVGIKTKDRVRKGDTIYKVVP